VKLSNVSEYVIPAITISPPSMEGFIPKPEEVIMENIEPQGIRSASFELIPLSRPSFELEEGTEAPSPEKEIEREWGPETAGEPMEWEIGKEELAPETDAGESMAFETEEEPEEEWKPEYVEAKESDEERADKDFSKETREGPRFIPLPPDPESLELDEDILAFPKNKDTINTIKMIDENKQKEETE
ncbi:MAG: hypothetical protein KAU14_05075, partial [Thermoplasmata archaeon]|nr:hypothetical protein [Thermoplasmata archaeon]